MGLRKQKTLPLLLVSMFLLSAAIGMPVMASSQSQNDVVVESTTATMVATTAPLETISAAYCGPIDLTIALDDTGSMGGAIANITAELPTIISTALAASGNDLRVGYITFKDYVHVRNQLTDDIDAVMASIAATSAGGGGPLPEASDEAKNTAVNNLDSKVRADYHGYTPAVSQIGNYTEPYRDNALKIVVLITDAPPGGFNDIQDVPDDNYALSTHYANQAKEKGILVSDIFVPTSGDYAGQAALLESDANITGGVYIKVNADGTGTGEAITAIIEACGGEPEVENRMTGGGILGDKQNKVTHGFELHCDASEGPNNLQVNWGKGDKFHLETLNKAVCKDDPLIEPNPPKAGFDTYVGTGTGNYNGVSGATATWTFTDAGEPGKNDFAEIVITDAGGNVVLSVSGTLRGGTHQAHTK